MTESILRRGPGPLQRLAPLAAAALLAACTTVGPDAKPPVTRLPAGFTQAGAAAAPNTQAVDPARIARFWRGFQDPVLDGLVEQALAANPELRLALARLQEARAGLREAEAAQRPSGGIDAGANRTVIPLTQAQGLSREARTGNILNAGFVASWELDFFGGLARSREAATATVAASEAGLQAVQVSLVAELAGSYLSLRGLQQRLIATEEALRAQRASVELLRLRSEAGRASDLDLARARGLLAGTEAALPALRAGIERQAFRIATLSGQAHGELLARLASPAPLPALPLTDLGALPVGTPAAWLQRRPDLIAAERELAAATARIGVATADLFPKVSLSGLLGLNAATVSGLARAGAGVYSLGAGLQWAPFDSGALRARIAAAEARSAQALARYDQAVAAALEETEAAFSDYSRGSERVQRLAEASRQNQEALRLATLRHDAGIDDYLSVLDAQREALASREAETAARTEVATALVSVYRSLGGGWDAASLPGAAPQAAAPAGGR
ncbi:efflux transporter outer membrane subunit [Piscinibacter sp. Jin2]|uniref:Efflux transporter outer membrane subunit n=1 Tax=Aquariibacter lacus TaxID=2801332 RepID=A0A9X0XFT3_9BURK|nr:efflux transporter outer membrane subunit [Piscinibacter lacus]MBL0720924.1 efflux transporter outer membrane subunit [Piscinibacter lacus]